MSVYKRGFILLDITRGQRSLRKKSSEVETAMLENVLRYGRDMNVNK